MNKVKSIQISKLEEEKKLGFSMLKLNIKGDNINHIIVNSIKRIIQSDIPVYSFNNFDITQNSSVFNNNYIKHHLQNIPVWGIENKIDEFVKKEETDEEEFSEMTGLMNDDIDLNVEKSVDTSALNKLTMYIDSKNDTKDILTVTTDDAKFYYKEGLIKTPYYNPIQLSFLQKQSWVLKRCLEYIQQPQFVFSKKIKKITMTLHLNQEVKYQKKEY